MAMRNWVLLGLKPATLWPSSIRFFSPSKGVTEFEMSMSSLVVIYEGQLLDPREMSMSAKAKVYIMPKIDSEMTMTAKATASVISGPEAQMTMTAKVAITVS